MIEAIANKQVMVGADSAGFELREAVKKHLIARRREVTDPTPVKIESGIYHQVGFTLSSKITEGEFERTLAFYGTDTDIRVAASKVPHMRATVVESVRAARRATAANGCNLLAMEGFWIGHRLGMAMTDAFPESHLDSGYEGWEEFLKYHQIGFNEYEHFDYEAYEASGFQVVSPATATLGSELEGLTY